MQGLCCITFVYRDNLPHRINKKKIYTKYTRKTTDYARIDEPRDPSFSISSQIKPRTTSLPPQKKRGENRSFWRPYRVLYGRTWNTVVRTTPVCDANALKKKKKAIIKKKTGRNSSAMSGRGLVDLNHAPVSCLRNLVAARVVKFTASSPSVLSPLRPTPAEIYKRKTRKRDGAPAMGTQPTLTITIGIERARPRRLSGPSTWGGKRWWHLRVAGLGRKRYRLFSACPRSDGLHVHRFLTGGP